jgi:1-pyrroline-5-carboxylate dehydrogenase
MRLFQEAGLPDGVINLVYGPAPTIGDAALASPDLAGIHFTGSTPVFHGMWRTVGANIELPQLPAHRRRDRRQGLHRRAPVRRRRRARDRDRPRLVRVPGPEVLGGVARLRAVEPLARAARALQERGRDDQGRATSPTFGNFMGAVIDSASFATQARGDRGGQGAPETEIVVGGGYDDSQGYFVEPTVIETRDPDFRLMREELFGPVVTTYVYDEKRWDETLDLVDRTRPTRSPAPSSPRTARDRRGAQRAAPRGRQLLRQRQADRRRRRPAAVRRRARLGHERQGRLDVEPDPLGVSPRTIKETFTPPTTTATRSCRSLCSCA